MSAEIEKDVPATSDKIKGGLTELNGQIFTPTPEAKTSIIERLKKNLLSDLFDVKTSLTSTPLYKIVRSFDIPIYEGYFNISITFCGMTLYSGSIDL